MQYTLRDAAVATALFALAATGACRSDDNTPATAGVELVSGPTGDIPNTQEIVLADMTAEHEAFPRGVEDDGTPAMEWVSRPRLSAGNDVPDGWDAFTAWGQVYGDRDGTVNPNLRFQLRNMRGYYLSAASGEWVELQSTSDFNGANYAEDFQNDANVAADLRDESDSGGGVSATLRDGYNFHFFPKARVAIDPGDVAGVWTVFEARLLPDDPTLPVDYAASGIIADGGADYWESLLAEWDQWTTNADVGIGRFKVLTGGWQSFNMHTLDAEALRANPVPIR